MIRHLIHNNKTSNDESQIQVLEKKGNKLLISTMKVWNGED